MGGGTWVQRDFSLSPAGIKGGSVIGVIAVFACNKNLFDGFHGFYALCARVWCGIDVFYYYMRQRRSVEVLLRQIKWLNGYRKRNRPAMSFIALNCFVLKPFFFENLCAFAHDVILCFIGFEPMTLAPLFQIKICH